MERIWQTGRLVLAGAILAAAAGCPTLDPRTSNQGGGSIATAGAKLAGGKVGALNPDEWQIVTDSAPAIVSQFGIDLGALASLPQLSDEQAAAIVALLEENGVNTLDDLERLVQAIAAGSVALPDVLLDLADEFAV